MNLVFFIRSHCVQSINLMFIIFNICVIYRIVDVIFKLLLYDSSLNTSFKRKANSFFMLQNKFDIVNPIHKFCFIFNWVQSFNFIACFHCFFISLCGQTGAKYCRVKVDIILNSWF